MSAFDSFILIAGMRTGSNFLESNLASANGVTSFGEAFNPNFIGQPKTQDLFGFTLADREKNPFALLDKIKATDGIGGFRFFDGHDPRILQACITDPRCAKIILTRDPLESFVSLKTAQLTDKWRMTADKAVDPPAIEISTDEFTTYCQMRAQFLGQVDQALLLAGQSALRLDYGDLQDLAAINGVLRFLGVPEPLPRLNKTFKKQSVAPLQARISNYAEVAAHPIANVPSARMDLPLEPTRGPAPRSYVASDRLSLLFMPLHGPADREVTTWLAKLDQQTLRHGMTMPEVKNWRGTHRGHRSFCVLWHPLQRAHQVFCEVFQRGAADDFATIRQRLTKLYDVEFVDLPDDPKALDPTTFAAHRAGFLGFLRFLHRNLRGQTSFRIDPHWASQLVLLQGVCKLAPPDMILREDELPTALTALAQRCDASATPFTPAQRPCDWLLAQIYDPEIEHAARSAYAIDYQTFGFESWPPDQAA